MVLTQWWYVRKELYVAGWNASTMHANPRALVVCSPQWCVRHSGVFATVVCSPQWCVRHGGVMYGEHCTPH